MPTKELVKVLIIIFGLLAVAGLAQHARSATTLLPNGEQCFQTGAGPVVSGSVNMYSVGTTTPKTTWTNSSQSATNTNPIQLDANGCAIIYGVGSYRQQLWSGPVVGGVVTGNLIYDLTTTDTSVSNSTFWAGTAGGTPNAITVVDTGFNNTDGSVINFLASATNTGATTLNVSGGGAINIEQSTANGPAALTGGCIVLNNPVSVVYSSSASAFLLLTGCPSTVAPVVALPTPGGYLTLSSDVNEPITNSDVLGSSSLFYTPINSWQVPIFNGGSFILNDFNQMSMNVSSVILSNTIYDVFAFLNNGATSLGVGPAWLTSAAGVGSRGTGAGTTQISRLQGLWVNTVAVSISNGVTTFSVPINQATYLGSIMGSQTANGQIVQDVGFGQARQWGVWNAYNRQPIIMQAGDPSVNWSYNTASNRASNNNSTNNVTVFMGLPEESADAIFVQVLSTSVAGQQIGIGINGFNFSGPPAFNSTTASQTLATTSLYTPTLGQSQIYSVEKGAGSGTGLFQGTLNGMKLTVKYRG